MKYPISLCMIVKNEESVLSDCLESAMDFVEEIIIVDTGSTDNTVNIASKYQAKVLNQQWQDDFAKARNFSIQQANSPWILTLDADERIENVKTHLLEHLINHPIGKGSLQVRSPYTQNGEQFEASGTLLRLFSRTHYYFNGRIHEQIRPVTPTLDQPALDSGISIFHSGYASEERMKNEKFNRNLSLLLLQLKQENNSPYVLYQIGRTYFVKGDLFQAKEFYERAIVITPREKNRFYHSLVIDYTYTLKGLALVQEGLEFLSKAEPLFTDSSELYFLLAALYTKIGGNHNIEKVLACYQNCLQIGETKQYDSVRGTGSYLAAQNLSYLLRLLGNHDLANEYLTYSKKMKENAKFL